MDSQNQGPEAIEIESQKLCQKYPGLSKNPSALLQRRLSKNVKYFDSGDYNMAKAKLFEKKSAAPTGLDVPTGETIPTPENIPTLRNKSISKPAGLVTLQSNSTSGAHNVNPGLLPLHPRTELAK